MNKVTIVLGEELFQFPSLIKWEQKGRNRYMNCGVKASDTIAIDAAGRVCTCGRDFERADKEDTYPIKVYHTVTPTVMGMPVIVDPSLPEGTVEVR